jgi:hypothetical protein
MTVQYGFRKENGNFRKIAGKLYLQGHAINLLKKFDTGNAVCTYSESVFSNWNHLVFSNTYRLARQKSYERHIVNIQRRNIMSTANFTTAAAAATANTQLNLQMANDAYDGAVAAAELKRIAIQGALLSMSTKQLTATMTRASAESDKLNNI